METKEKDTTGDLPACGREACSTSANCTCLKIESVPNCYCCIRKYPTKSEIQQAISDFNDSLFGNFRF